MTADELRAFEARVADAFNAGKIRAPVHLDGGNEEQLIEVFKPIRRPDWVFCSWRSHYKALLHGVKAERVWDEIIAGRSIALCFPDHRFFSSAIVGGIIPIAVGAAMGIKRRKGHDRVHVFVGDMTATIGIFRECVAYSRGHHLPINFILEDNGRSVCTPTAEVWGWPPIVSGIERFEYESPWPHAGAGKRVQF